MCKKIDADVGLKMRREFKVVSFKDRCGSSIFSASDDSQDGIMKISEMLCDNSIASVLTPEKKSISASDENTNNFYCDDDSDEEDSLNDLESENESEYTNSLIGTEICVDQENISVVSDLSLSISNRSKTSSVSDRCSSPGRISDVFDVFS